MSRKKRSLKERLIGCSRCGERLVRIQKIA